MRVLLLLILVGCSTPKWYRVSCNKHVSGTAMSEKMLIEHLDNVGFHCNNNDAKIDRIKNKKVIKALNKMESQNETK